MGKPKCLALLAALALAGCNGQPLPLPVSLAPAVSATTPTDPIASISNFTVTDLQQADAIAVANNDAIGHACFPALTRFVQSLPTSMPSTTVAGAFSAFETARTARIKVQNAVGSGIPDYLKLGCAALVQDEATFVTKLAALGAGAGILPGGAAAAVSGALAPIITQMLP